MVTQAPSESLSLLNVLRKTVGRDGVFSADAVREFAATDVYRRGELPAYVIRPPSVDALAQAVRAATAAGMAVFVRGGGASYSDGYAPTTPNSISIDMRSLDRIVDIDEDNAYVTVEAGCSWAKLHEALAARGLRTPFFGPFSGLAASIGGSVSQHAVSHGSGRFGASADSVLSMEVVLADGTILRTGSAAIAASGESEPRRFFRHHGPDLTGLLCGDCGALGVKATVTLPIIKTPAASEALAFSFPTFAGLHQAMAAIAKIAVDDENFGLDIALQQGQIARNEATAAKLQLAWQVFKSAPSWARGIDYLARMAVAGSRHLREPGYSVSYIVKGPNLAAARGNAAAIRDAALQFGHEVPNTIPRVVASMPFAPLHNVLGPNGERWVPIHGILQHGDVIEFHKQYQALLKRYAQQCDAHGVWTGGMFQSIGSSAFLYEIAFYWPDELHTYHLQTLDSAFVKDLPKHPANPDGAATVEALKTDTIKLFSQFGAVHLQLGKAYPFLPRLELNAAALLRSLKTELDPHGLMNPGALGL